METFGDKIIRPVLTIFQSNIINITVQNLPYEKFFHHLTVNWNKLILESLARKDF